MEYRKCEIVGNNKRHMETKECGEVHDKKIVTEEWHSKTSAKDNFVVKYTS